MRLTLRPTGLGSGIDNDRPDYTCCGGWDVGRERCSTIRILDLKVIG
jgi:hypothetical protein